MKAKCECNVWLPCACEAAWVLYKLPQLCSKQGSLWQVCLLFELLRQPDGTWRAGGFYWVQQDQSIMTWTILVLLAEWLPGLTWLLQSLRRLHGLHLQYPFLCFGTPWSWTDASNGLAHPGLLSTPGCQWLHKQNLQTKICFTNYGRFQDVGKWVAWCACWATSSVATGHIWVNGQSTCIVLFNAVWWPSANSAPEWICRDGLLACFLPPIGALMQHCQTGTSKLMQHEGCASFQNLLHQMPLQASEMKRYFFTGLNMSVVKRCTHEWRTGGSASLVNHGGIEIMHSHTWQQCFMHVQSDLPQASGTWDTMAPGPKLELGSMPRSFRPRRCGLLGMWKWAHPLCLGLDVDLCLAQRACSGGWECLGTGRCSTTHSACNAR